MISVFTIIHEGDIYEVSLHGLVLDRVARYADGSPLRQDLDFDNLLPAVQEKILEKVTDIYKKLKS